MKKIYSIVLMATALLIGTNVMAANVAKIGSTEYASLEEAWAAVDNGQTIQLISDATITKTLWLGTAKMNDASKSIVLDLNGKTLSAASSLKKMFFISHGELLVKTSLAGGNILHEGDNASSTWEVFRMSGSTYKNLDPKTATSGYYTHLTIAEGVLITANSNALVLDRMDGWSNMTSPVATKGVTAPSSLPYSTSVYKYKKDNDRGLANGARLDVKGTILANKYGIKANGNMGSPAFGPASNIASFKADPEGTVDYSIDKDNDENYAPFIYIHPSAVIKTQKPTSTAAIATYSGGYSRWQIEGYCEGSTGVYVKSGEVVIKDAVVKSNYEGTYVSSAEDRKSGVDAGGSGIAIASASAYAGNIDVQVQGDTKVTPTSGYAIDEAVVAESGVTKVDGVTITGGTFETGGQGTIKISEPTAAANASSSSTTEITIAGGNMESIQLGEGTTHNLNEVIKPVGSETNVHVTYVDNGKGGQTMIITQGAAPHEYATIAAAGTDKSVKLTGATDAIAKDAVVALDELEMSEATAQTLTINEGAKFTVGKVNLGPKAQIIVMPGAKFIVDGEQGIYAPAESNIVLKNEEGKRSIFLFNPAVTSNKHPNARVELITNSWREDANNLQWEVVGFPTFGTVKNLAVDGSTQVALAILNSNGQFITEGLIGSIDLAKLNKTFAPYDLLANRAKNVAAPKIVIEGELIGNVNADMNAYLRWTPLANSYTGELDMKAFLSALAGAQYVAKGVWVAEQQGNGNLAWQPVDLQAIEDGDEGAITKLAPMQAFMLNNPGQYSEVRALNYASMVWAPATSVPNQGAPARSTTANETTAKARVIVANEQGVVDKVMLRENANNVYALEKYMNEDMNIYVLADEKSAIVNSEDMENTYVGFSTVNGGKFTISFASVTGREFVLVDHETGAQVAIAEGNTYEFTAAANSTNDYRFEIVERNYVPTAIENTEAVKSAKGIYTITGQYVGEMNVWNTLPAGIYVVNGEKRVK